MSELVGIDRITGAEATKKLLDDLQGASRISETVLGNLYSFHAAAEAANASIAKILIDTQKGIKFSQLEGIISKEWMIPRESLLGFTISVPGLRFCDLVLRGKMDVSKPFVEIRQKC